MINKNLKNIVFFENKELNNSYIKCIESLNKIGFFGNKEINKINKIDIPGIVLRNFLYVAEYFIDNEGFETKNVINTHTINLYEAKKIARIKCNKESIIEIFCYIGERLYEGDRKIEIISKFKNRRWKKISNNIYFNFETNTFEKYNIVNI